MNLDSAKTFDVIIVGAGPAGCVLANRLSEEPGKQALLLEAGPDAAVPGAEHPDLLDPFCLIASDNSAFRWPGLMAEIGADRGDGTPRTVSAYIQGFSVGGGSNINGMGVERGQPADYDEWRDLGAAGWGWEDVLPYFKKLEHDLDFPNATAMHGDTGPMPVRRLPRARWAPFAASVGDALERRGFPFIEDYTADLREGFSAATTNCLPQRRVSASMAYLTEDVRRRPNLHILANARVERLSFEGTRATGVFVRMNGGVQRVSSHQVILSCGALQSPSLLMRSGIGPRAHLAEHGIEVVRDLPGVGANLQNHPVVTLAIYLPRKAEQPADNPWFLQNWCRFSSRHPRGVPNDMHVLIMNKGAWHALGRRVGVVAVSVFKPYSKGTVELSGADPMAMPNIRFSTLSDPRDEERLIGGVRFILELLSEPGVAEMRHQLFMPNYHLAASLSPRNTWNRLKASAIARILDWSPLRQILLRSSSIDMQGLLADGELLRRFVRTYVRVQLHVCGTCRMGRAEDPGTVVDNAGRVHGMEGLRVVDASVFPTIPRSNMQFPVLMTAEKMADAVRDDWRVDAADESRIGSYEESPEYGRAFS